MCTASHKMTRLRVRLLNPALADLRLQRESKARAPASVPPGAAPSKDKLAARRRLFDANPTDTSAFVEKEMKRNYESIRERWEFDTILERPLPVTSSSRWSWYPPVDSINSVKAPQHTKQTSIKDYMQPRKRAASGDCPSPKKLACLSMDAIKPISSLAAISTSSVDSDVTSSSVTAV